jgi:hypothetical protein
VLENGWVVKPSPYVTTPSPSPPEAAYVRSARTPPGFISARSVSGSIVRACASCASAMRSPSGVSGAVAEPRLPMSSAM